MCVAYTFLHRSCWMLWLFCVFLCFIYLGRALGGYEQLLYLPRYQYSLFLYIRSIIITTQSKVPNVTVIGVLHLFVVQLLTLYDTTVIV